MTEHKIEQHKFLKLWTCSYIVNNIYYILVYLDIYVHIIDVSYYIIYMQHRRLAEYG